MKRIMALLVVLLSVVAPGVAHAGGWAVGSLDPLPPVRAGQSVDVGFRLLQHGRTPVVASEWQGASIGLGVRIDGRETFVPASAVGEPGHYVATVDVPADIATLAISVQMRDGLMVDESWADVPVGTATAGAGGTADRLPTWTVPLFALLAIACAAVLVVDVWSTRRRRDGVAASPAA